MLQAEHQIFEFLKAWLHADTPAIAIDQRQLPRATPIRVPQLGRLATAARHRSQGASAAIARIHETHLAQFVQRVEVEPLPISLPAEACPGTKRIGGIDIWPKTEPVEIVEDARFILRPAALAIVILDAQEDARTALPRELPDADGVPYVAEVQPPCWSRRKARAATLPRGHGESLRRRPLS